MASFIIIILGYPLFKIWPLGQNDGVAGNRMMEKISGTGGKKVEGQDRYILSSLLFLGDRGNRVS